MITPVPSIGQSNQMLSVPSAMSIANHMRLRTMEIPRIVERIRRLRTQRRASSRAASGSVLPGMLHLLLPRLGGPPVGAPPTPLDRPPAAGSSHLNG